MVLKELKPSVTCLQETNKNWKRCGQYHEKKTILNTVWRKTNWSRQTLQSVPLHLIGLEEQQR
eukprot:4028845-Ditylum_brightwellii.AAC.2